MLEIGVEREIVRDDAMPPATRSIWQGFPAEALTRFWAEQRLREERVAQESVRLATHTTAYVVAATAAVFLAAACWCALYCLEFLPHLARVCLATAMLVASQGTAWFVSRRGPARVTELLLFFCALLFAVTTCTLVFDSQISSPVMPLLRADRVFVVALLPLALIADSALVYLAFGLALAVCGYIEFSLVGPTFDPWRFVHLLPLGLVPGFVWGYRRKSTLVIGAQVVLLALWLLILPIHCKPELYFAFAALSLGVTALFVAECHPPTLAPAWRLPGLTLLGGPLTVLVMRAMWEELGHKTGEPSALLNAENLAPRVVCESFVAVLLLVAFLVTARLALWRRSCDQPVRAMTAVLTRQLWFPAAMAVCVTFLNLWHCSSPAWGWFLTPVIVSNVATIVLATYLIDIGVRNQQGYAVAAGLCGAARVLWHIVQLDNSEDARVTILCVLTTFGLLLLGLAYAWLRLKPAVPDTLKWPERTWRLPAHVERLCGFCARQTVWLLVFAFALQHGSLVLIYSTLLHVVTADGRLSDVRVVLAPTPGLIVPIYSAEPDVRARELIFRDEARTLE